MDYEPAIRLVVFILVFSVMASWELWAPRRALTISKKLRWFNNLSIIFFNIVLVRLVLPVLALDMAIQARQHEWGLLNNADLPHWLDIVITIIVLDITLYLQHVIFHAVPILWRLHMVHHADLDFDFTTGLRFHPIEIILSAVLKVAVVLIIGAPAVAVLIFELLLNSLAMFNHGNVRIPLRIDRLLRFWVVTPDMHRVHHSVIIRETNSNFGFNLSLWDRLCGTYRDQPVKGHNGMVIGLSQFRSAQKLNLSRLLILPFSGDPGKYPINRH